MYAEQSADGNLAAGIVTGAGYRLKQNFEASWYASWCNSSCAARLEAWKRTRNVIEILVTVGEEQVPAYTTLEQWPYDVVACKAGGGCNRNAVIECPELTPFFDPTWGSGTVR